MKYRKKPVTIEAYQTDVDMDIPTLEGTMHASVGDYIITGVRGEQYPCKPDIFLETYEPAEGNSEPHLRAGRRGHAGPRITGDTSDGYHTFNELYHHRAVLFSVIVRDHQELAWKSKLHHDGTMYDGMFIVGIDTPNGQATYHYAIDPYWEMFDCKELERAPEWDGHSPDDAIERISTLGSFTVQATERTDKDSDGRGECHVEETDTWECVCDQIGRYGKRVTIHVMECSACGQTFEHVNGGYEHCPRCGAAIREG